MNLHPLLDASFAIQFHVATVVPAAVLGAYVLLTRKGTPRHRMLGKIWLALMVLTSLSTFFIHTIRLVGPFSPIHLLSAGVLVSSWLAIRAARQRNIIAHKRYVTSMYFGGILIAGLFTLMPGRIMNQVVLGGSAGSQEQAIWTIAGAAVAGFAALAYGRLSARSRRPRRAS